MTNRVRGGRTAAILGTGAGVIALGAGAALSQDLTPVSYGTNWVAQAEHGGFYQSVVDGTYAACGLDVTIVPGGPQVNNEALMLAGRIDFYMGSSLGVLNGQVEGLPTINVAALFQKDPQVFLTHPDRVSSFEELADLPTILVADGGYTTYYRWLISALGFTEEQRAPYTFNAAPFIADPDSAMQGYLTSEPLIVEREAGWAPDVWLIADAGYETYSTTIETLRETVEERPEVVQCFVDGSIIGWYNYLYNDNTAANDAIKAANPDITDEIIAFAIEQMKAEGIVDSGDALESGIGVMTQERIDSFYAQMVEAGVLPEGLDMSQSFTTAFVGNDVGMDLKPAE
jgi:NitT/TauT family transport system substrate-binding protein